MQFQPATREGVKLLVGLFGKSGGGKTRTALILARGIVGPNGKIGVIDTERRRASIFADLIPGGYQTLDLDEPFTPERYLEALGVAMKSVDILILDQITAEWSGEGGVLEMQEAELQRMAGDDYKKRDACKMAAWIKPKMRHNKFVRDLLRSSIPLIVIMRGKDKTHVEKGENGKTKVVTDDFSSPIFDGDFIYELLLCGEIYQRGGQGGYFRPEKVTHPDVADLIPKEDEQFTIEHGARLAAWANGGGAKPKPQTKAKPVDPTNDLVIVKKNLWNKVKSDYDDVFSFEKWLIEKGIISDTEQLSTMPIERLLEVSEAMNANK